MNRFLCFVFSILGPFTWAFLFQWQWNWFAPVAYAAAPLLTFKQAFAARIVLGALRYRMTRRDFIAGQEQTKLDAADGYKKAASFGAFVALSPGVVWVMGWLIHLVLHT